MKHEWKVVTGLLVLSIAMVGCTQSGYLTVENVTNGPLSIDVDGSDEDLDSGDDISFEYEFPGLLLNIIQQETEEIDVAYTGMYVFSGEDTVEIEAGDDEVFEIEADGGAVIVANNSSRAIIGVWLKPASSSTWSGNLIEGGVISSGGAVYWTVTPGPWNIDVLDADGYYPAELPEQTVVLDSARVMAWNETEWSFQGSGEGSIILGTGRPKIVAEPGAFRIQAE